MRLVSIKAAFASVWVVAVFVAGLAGTLNSVASWAVVAGVALVPPAVLMWRWNDPVQSLSESIQEARR